MRETHSALGATKAASSEQSAAGSNSDYKQTVGRWQWALGSKKANTREQLVQITHQQAVNAESNSVLSYGCKA